MNRRWTRPALLAAFAVVALAAVLFADDPLTVIVNERAWSIAVANKQSAKAVYDAIQSYNAQTPGPRICGDTPLASVSLYLTGKGSRAINYQEGTINTSNSKTFVGDHFLAKPLNAYVSLHGVKPDASDLTVTYAQGGQTGTAP